MQPICYVDQFSRKKEKFRSVKANFFVRRKKGKTIKLSCWKKNNKKGFEPQFLIQFLRVRI